MGPVSKKAENHGVKFGSSGMSQHVDECDIPEEHFCPSPVAQQWYMATLVLYTL